MKYSVLCTRKPASSNIYPAHVQRVGTSVYPLYVVGQINESPIGKYAREHATSGPRARGWIAESRGCTESQGNSIKSIWTLNLHRPTATPQFLLHSVT